MKTLVIYDVTEDVVRNEVARICESFGLMRIQKSAFIGYLPSSRRKELSIRLRKAVAGANANVQIFTFCRYCRSLREIIGGDLEHEAPSTIVL